MVHSHQHEDNTHAHPIPAFNKAFLIAITVNGLFVVIQIIFAYIANSTGLLADAIHNLGDVLSLVLAFIANGLLKRAPTERSTYGMKKTSILAAFANGGLMIFTCGIIVTEAMYKFFSPSEIHAPVVMLIAGTGILVNGATAALFLGGKKDLNIRAAYLHLVYDALISLGVVISAGLIYLTNWHWLDPLTGILIAIIILKGTWSLFADSFRLITDGVPSGISVSKVRELFMNHEGIKDIHDLHVWAISTQENALSVHVWMPEATLDDVARENLTHVLCEEYNIQHVTIQVEKTQAYCKDACISYL